VAPSHPGSAVRVSPGSAANAEQTSRSAARTAARGRSW